MKGYNYHSNILVFIKEMRIISFIILLCCFCSAWATETSPATENVDYIESTSGEELYKLSKKFRHQDPHQSMLLAVAALDKAKRNHNEDLEAKTHTLLGKLYKEANNIEQSLEHFSIAPKIHKQLKDNRNHIVSSLNYIELLLSEEHFEQADNIIEELLPIALAHNDPFQIGSVFIANGLSCYLQEQYDEAIKQYLTALDYLNTQDKGNKKKLAQSYEKIAHSYKNIDDEQNSVLFYKKALTIYTKLNYTKSMARVLKSLADGERNIGNLVQALDYSIRSLEIHKLIDDPLGRTKALMGAGIIYRFIGRYEKSLEHIQQAYQYYKDVNDINGVAKTSIQIGLLYSRLQQFHSARSYYQNAIDLAEKNIELSTLSAAYREMAVIELNFKDFDSAHLMANKAYQINQIENDKLNQSITARIIADIYKAENNTGEAIKFYRQSLTLAEDTGSKINQLKTLNELASLLIVNHTDEAINLLNRSLKLSAQVDDKAQELYANSLLRKAEKLRGNIADSLKHAEAEILLSEIIQNENDKNKLIVTKANLHSYKLESELALLKEKATLVQLELDKKNNEIEIVEQARTINELKLVKNRYANIALFMLLIFVLFVAVLIYRRFLKSNQRNIELDYLAARDPLTNCYNRRVLFDVLSKDIKDANFNKEYCLIIVDIDHFKNVNDTYGHSVGDYVIKGVADALQNSVRQDDIVARFGGEEFCIVLHGVAIEQSERIAEKMRIKIENLSFEEVSVTCSFGVTSAEFGAASPEILIQQADTALYKSKSLGRNRVTLWSDE